MPVELVARPGEDAVGIRTWGSHPIAFIYDPLALWRELGRPHALLDIHEEPYSLATAEILTLRALRGLLGNRSVKAPYIMYSAQNITKTHPLLFRWIERSSLREVSAVSVCNDEAGRILRGKGLRTPARTISLGIDPLVFSPARRGEMRRPHGGEIRVGYVGRLESHKGVHVLLAAVASDPRLHLSIVGGGPRETQLHERAQQTDLAGRVEFLGHLSGSDLAVHYQSLDVLAVPSLPTSSWLEQFGRVAVEAMASGVPVVASDTGALPDVLDGAGTLVPPGDAAALRDALLRVGTSPDLRAGHIAAGLDRAAQYSWDAVGEAYLRLYTDVVTNHLMDTHARMSARNSPAAAARAPASHDVGKNTTDDSLRSVEVVVVAYGSPHLLDRTLAPIAQSFPIIVVDNSSNQVIRRLCERYGARYIDPGRNSGFAAGVNEGLRAMLNPDADVLLLNPDAVVQPQDVRRLQQALRSDPDLASVGPTQVDEHGAASRVIWPFPSPAGSWLTTIGLGALHRREDFVIGSVLLIRGQALADVGGLDERFFLYAEETDWARRARHAGWHHGVVTTATAMHVGGGTSDDTRLRDTYFHASQEVYFRKHFGASGWAVNRAAVITGSAVRAVVLTGSRRTDAGRRLMLYVRGPAKVQRQLTARQ
ncbi:glycosyltransferase [Sanguibacter gelidistatuariae]|nr:glycosyltransferase [Sanguibacter gelidistatuariae]